MKPIFLIPLLLTLHQCMGQAIDNTHLLRATISKTDSTLSLTANIRLDHRIFGYAEPDTHSKKLILLSVFTSDVENNPYKCVYGAYYQTSDMMDMSIKYRNSQKQFIKADLIKNNSVITSIYILKRWVKFEL